MNERANMTTNTIQPESVHTLDIGREINIAAPIEITFESILEELGPGSVLPDGKPFPMKIEPWPGGRWYRDLGGLDRPNKSPPEDVKDFFPTIASSFTFMALHQMNHAGQVVDARRAAGRKPMF
jgi:hypothetical protein